MRLVKTHFYVQKLKGILRFIALDNPPAALNFDKALSAKLALISEQPLMCRKSKYMNAEAYRDLIHQGYTVVYKVENDKMILLDIFKLQDSQVH